MVLAIKANASTPFFIMGAISSLACVKGFWVIYLVFGFKF